MKGKGKRKDSESVELTMSILKAQYNLVVPMMKEQQNMIDAMPAGKEKNFLQRDLDTWRLTIENHLGFKQGLLDRMGIAESALTYVFSKAELKDIYERIKDIPGLNDEEEMPEAR